MRIVRLAVVVAVAAALGGCSSSGLAKFKAGVNNVVEAVNTVNDAIAEVSPALHANCVQAAGVAKALADLDNWRGFNAADAAVGEFCQRPPATNIGDAISAVAAAVRAGQAAYRAARG